MYHEFDFDIILLRFNWYLRYLSIKKLKYLVIFNKVFGWVEIILICIIDILSYYLVLYFNIYSPELLGSNRMGFGNLRLPEQAVVRLDGFFTFPKYWAMSNIVSTEVTTADHYISHS